MPLRPGDRIPKDLLLLDSSGEQRTLAGTFDGEAGLLIHLRHLG